MALAVAVGALVLAGCGGAHHASQRASAPRRLVDLRSVAQLRSLFDRASGVPRLVLIVSPT